MDTPLRLDLSKPTRFERFDLIAWWEQSRLTNAKVLVVGAGALGNELLKNLALLGVGQVVVADKDTIELSNLSRSVLFREGDLGKPKASVAAAFAKQIYPEMKVTPFVGDIVNDLGTGVFRWADVVLGGLDNREARLWINQVCWRLGKPWIDGAIEQIQGVARVFAPDPLQENPCYECTMSEHDWNLLRQRRSCTLLTRQQMTTGHTPTTPTISAIIAGVQCQEALKQLHNMETLAGKGWVFAGLTNDSYIVDYQRNPQCTSHETFSEVLSLQVGCDDISMGELLGEAEQTLGSGAQIDLGREIVESFDCPQCGDRDTVYRPLSSLREGQAACPHCPDHPPRLATLIRRVTRDDAPLLLLTPKQIGLPAFDVILTRNGGKLIGLELSGDAASVLGELHSSELTWS